jgi:hypothetical protein
MRYFTRPKAIKPRAEWDDDTPMLPSLEVPEHGPIDTGLVDLGGWAIWRAPRPIGFGRMEEW